MAIVAVAAASCLASDRETYLAVSDKIYYRQALGQSLESLLWGHPGEMEQATEQLHDLVTKTAMETLLAGHASSATLLRAIQELQGPATLHGFDVGSNIPFADIESIGTFQTALLAFSVMRGGEGIPTNVSWIQFYSNRDGAWKLISEQADGAFDGAHFSLSRLSNGTVGKTRHIVWGTRIGDTGARLYLRVYTFDGVDVETIYSRDAVVGGVLSLNGGKFSLDYTDRLGSLYAVHEEFASDSSGVREVSHTTSGTMQPSY